jgi:acetyl esterase/lipase
MKRSTVFCFCLLATALNPGSLPAAELPERILLWPQGAPGSEGKAAVENVRVTDSGDRVVSGVHQPALFPYLPPEARATGTAVIVVPGGGHRELWSTHEGHHLAQWLSDRGVAAFVLYHRLARETNSTYTVDGESLADTQRAIKLVRSRAGEWNLQPDRIGVLGFSAGGELAALADMRPVTGDAGAGDPVERVGSKPDFQALIYPGSSRRFEAGKSSSPVFIVAGYNDRPDISRGMAEVYLKYKEAGVPAELHIYAKAGHGFGVRDTLKGAVGKWPERFVDWLADLGMLKRE